MKWLTSSCSPSQSRFSRSTVRYARAVALGIGIDHLRPRDILRAPDHAYCSPLHPPRLQTRLHPPSLPYGRTFSCRNQVPPLVAPRSFWPSTRRSPTGACHPRKSRRSTSHASFTAPRKPGSHLCWEGVLLYLVSTSPSVRAFHCFFFVLDLPLSIPLFPLLL